VIGKSIVVYARKPGGHATPGREAAA
jgi:hypothetical protein